MFHTTADTSARRSTIAAALAAAFLAGCSGGGTPAVGPANNPALVGDANSHVRENQMAANGARPTGRSQPVTQSGVQRNDGMQPGAKAGSNLMYSGDYDTNTITIFPSKGLNPPPVGQITTGLNSPERLFVDNGLKLYATNIGNNTIVVYKPGGTSPSLTIGDGVNSPTGLTVGADGTVYCANTGNDTVTEYKRGKTKPAVTLSLGNEDPENLALDSKNNLYVSYLGGAHGGNVVEFAPGKTTGTELNLVVGGAGAIEVDRSGNIILIDSSVPSVDVFPAGKTSPSKKIPIVGGSPFELSLSKDEKHLYASVEVGIPFAILTTGYPKGSAFKNKITSNVGDWPLAVSPDDAL
jgi:hypothetical protein